MNFNDTIAPTFPPASASSEDEVMGGAHPEDMVYLIVCVVVFFFAVFGTMMFDKRQQTEQRIQRIRLIMQSLVIQSVERDGQPVGKRARSSSEGTEALDSSTSSTMQVDNDKQHQPCEDVESQIVGDVQQEEATKNGFTLSLWKQRITNVASRKPDSNPQFAAATSRDSSEAEESSTASEQEEEEQDVCPICIMPFQVGDKVCWSKNPDCNHAFHTECVKPWLMDHSECPCCRKEYLTFSKREKEAQERRALEEKALQDMQHALAI